MLKIGRDLTEGNECGPFAIRRVVYPGLHAALDVQSGGWRVDPPRGHKHERGKRPKKHDGEAKPSR
jgi:hypothetical protein